MMKESKVQQNLELIDKYKFQVKKLSSIDSKNQDNIDLYTPDYKIYQDSLENEFKSYSISGYGNQIHMKQYNSNHYDQDKTDLSVIQKLNQVPDFKREMDIINSRSKINNLNQMKTEKEQIDIRQNQNTEFARIRSDMSNKQGLYQKIKHENNLLNNINLLGGIERTVGSI